MSAVIEQTEQTTAMILTALLRPNDYNPNVMTDDEFGELVAEVRHLGRLPKPVVARPNGDGYVIVDGEHGWRAAREVGLTEVPCEVIAADDFEAMRQTYKRNQHGTHNPVQLGRMFRQMMEARGLSQRALAEEVHVSEGTIRNALEYAKAADVRNGYAFDKLTLKQVRYFNRLPPKLANVWLHFGAQVKDLWRVKTDEEVREAERHNEADDIRGYYAHLEETGLVDFLLQRTPRPGGFQAAIKLLEEWNKLELEWARAGLQRAQLREYTVHYYRAAFVVREAYLMSSALSYLIDTSTRPPTFRLTPAEFEAVIKDQNVDGESAMAFGSRLELAVALKTGRRIKSKGSVNEELLQIEIDSEAPDYIRQSKLYVGAKYALWKASNPFNNPFASPEDRELFEKWGGAIKRGIAKLEQIKRRKDEKLDEAIARLIREAFDRWKTRAKLDRLTGADLARLIAERLPIYDKNKDAEALSILTNKLATLTKDELMSLEKYTEEKWLWDRHVGLMKAMTSNIKG